MKTNKLDVDDQGGSPTTRWVERPPGGSAPEDRLVSLMRRAEHSRGLDPTVRSRVLQRLNTGASRRDRAAPMLRWGLAAFVLLSSGGVIASVGLGRWWRPVPAALPAPQVRPPTKAPRSARRPVVEDSAPTPVVAAEEAIAPTAAATAATAAAEAPAPEVVREQTPPPAPATRVVASQSPRRPEGKARLARNSVTAPPRLAAVSAPAIEPAAQPLAERPVTAAADRLPSPPVTPPRPLLQPPPTRPALPMPTALSAEAQLIKSALLRLRRDRDAAGALEQLDLYMVRFPRGTLQHEARIARADALLSLNRDPEALEALEGVNLGLQGRDQELRVIRGEMRSARRCAQAIDDFTQVLAATPPAPLAERALYGRAACRVRQGDSEGAARDLTAYLRRFPAGRFAADARAAKAAVEN